MQVMMRQESLEQGQRAVMVNGMEGVQTGRCNDHVVP